MITSHSSWRWIFYFNLPPACLAIVLLIIAWPPTRAAGRIAWRQLDVLGALLYGAASLLLIFALQEAGAYTYAWNSAIIIGCLVSAVVAITCFAIWTWYLSRAERRIAPLFPARVITDRVVVGNIA